eukprot:symbB.v1.2.018543.t1/scaffold1479.1/size116273/2
MLKPQVATTFPLQSLIGKRAVVWQDFRYPHPPLAWGDLLNLLDNEPFLIGCPKVDGATDYMWNVDGKEGVLCLVTSNHQVQGSDALETAAWRSRFGLMLHFPNTLPEPDVSLKRACSCTKCYATWLIGDLERGPEPRTRDRSRSLRIHRRQG